MKYEVIFKTGYVEREIYILKIGNKYTAVYKSSGLSGTGHKGLFLPFSKLNDTYSYSCIYGYIYKEMFYNNSYLYHRKDIDNFPSIKKFMNQLSNELVKELPQPSYETFEDLQNLVNSVNKEINKYIHKDEFDYIDLY